MKKEGIQVEELKRELKKVVWDYSLSEELLLDIFLSDRDGYSLTSDDLKVRLLEYVSWHKLVRILSLANVMEFLEPRILSKVYPKSYQKQLYDVRKILSKGAIPSAR